jgi:hypothetical protein
MERLCAVTALDAAIGDCDPLQPASIAAAKQLLNA